MAGHADAVEARAVWTFPVSQAPVGDCRLTNTRPIMSTGIWPAAILPSLATPARISPAANHIRASSPGRPWRRHGQRWGSWKPHAGIQRQPSARSGASVHTAAVQRDTEAVEGLRLLCGVVENPTDNRRAWPLCHPAAAAHSRAISRRPRRNPPHLSRAWGAPVSTQAPSRAGGALGVRTGAALLAA
jgi:hypothetical protein